MHVRIENPELQRPLMTFLRGEGMIVFADDDTLLEVVVPHLYGDQEIEVLAGLLDRFNATLLSPVVLTLEP